MSRPKYWTRVLWTKPDGSTVEGNFWYRMMHRGVVSALISTRRGRFTVPWKELTFYRDQNLAAYSPPVKDGFRVTSNSLTDRSDI